MRSGYHVVQANDGLEGVKIIQQNSVDLVITDLLMPEQEGIETILQMRNDHPNVPIIAMSGGGRMTGTVDILQSAKLLGAVRTFSKPFNPMEVIQAIKVILGETV